jgi:hypothetical protein
LPLNINIPYLIPSTENAVLKKCNFGFSFYGCASWFLTLIEKHRLKEAENRVLRRIVTPKRNEIA